MPRKQRLLVEPLQCWEGEVRKWGAITGAFSRMFNDDAAGHSGEIKKSVFSTEASCTVPSQCEREKFYGRERVNRYETLPMLSSPSRLGKYTITDGIALAIDGFTQSVSSHYIDTVKVTYTERLYDVTETQWIDGGELIGTRTYQSWGPGERAGDGFIRNVINSEWQGLVHYSNRRSKYNVDN